MKAADELAKHVGVKPACAALEVSRSTLYRRRGPSTGQQQPRPTPARALSETERGEVFDTLCSERFVDRSPAEVVATLLDEEVYLCSERTMYRVLASEVPVQERRAQRTHPEYKKPEWLFPALWLFWTTRGSVVLREPGPWRHPRPPRSTRGIGEHIHHGEPVGEFEESDKQVQQVVRADRRTSLSQLLGELLGR